MKAETLFLTCTQCGEIWEVPAAEGGRPHECPSCHAAVVPKPPELAPELQATPPLPPPPPARARPQSKQVHESTFWGFVLQLIGWPMAILALLFSVGALISLFKAEPTGSTVLVFLFFGALVVLGSAFIGWGRRCGTYWICSECGNRLSSKEAKLCATCKADFRT
jgi:hypothetical protein